MDQENNQEYFDQKLNEVIRLQTITEHKKIACFIWRFGFKFAEYNIENSSKEKKYIHFHNTE